jgi:hypothetical protein
MQEVTTEREVKLPELVVKLYAFARATNPSRWSGRIRRWSQPDHVALNKREKARKAA